MGVCQPVGSLPRGSDIRYRALVDGHAFARDRGLVNGARPFRHKAIGRQALIRADDHNIAYHEFLDAYLLDSLAALHASCFGSELGERFDRSFRATHCIALKGVAEAEQKKQQRALRPFAEDRSARSRHKHKTVDLEPAEPEIVPGLSECVEPTEKICRNVAEKRHELGVVPP